MQTMVETVWHRLESIMGTKPLTVVALRDALGFSFQAAEKIRKGGGLGRENLLKVAHKYKVDPTWLATGKGKRTLDVPTPPPAPAAELGPFDALTAEEIAFLEDFRWLLDSDRERYRSEIAAKAKELREHMGKVLGDLQKPALKRPKT
jgi:hypothetical protein